LFSVSSKEGVWQHDFQYGYSDWLIGIFWKEVKKMIHFLLYQFSHLISGFIIGTVVGKVFDRTFAHMDRTEQHFDHMEQVKEKEKEVVDEYGIFRLEGVKRW
jgi:hypothetical protein